RLGPESIALGGRAIRANSLPKVSRPVLETLAQQTKETVTIEILSGEQSLTLDEISGSYVVGVSRYIGTRWPLHATSTGKVLLAHLPPARLDEVLSAPLAAYTPHTMTDIVALRQELANVQEQGYAIGNEELEIGFIAVGAPVRDHNGGVVAAIGVGGSSARLSQTVVYELIDLVMAAAQRISEQLGYRGFFEK
ncbi:MAG: IclR family transcriptional regulator, partial [Anaerolineae bacterium]|nr:IclR family transcriptional regulator [Anaerolineae bacterium]